MLRFDCEQVNKQNKTLFIIHEEVYRGMVYSRASPAENTSMKSESDKISIFRVT